MTGRWKADYDVQVAAASPSLDKKGDWVTAGVDDAASRIVTPLRRFLWRYGRDLSSPRSRYKLLVETFLVSKVHQNEMPLTWAKQVIDALPGESDGEILKMDLFGNRDNVVTIV